MKIRIYLLILLLLAGNVVFGQAQKELIEIRGQVFSSVDKSPVEGASVLAVSATKTAVTDEKGNFVLQVAKVPEFITVNSTDYLAQEFQLYGRQEVKIYLLPLKSRGYSNTMVLPFQVKKTIDKTGNSITIYTRDMDRGRKLADEMLVGNVAGVRALQKSGMPGEGYFLALRGTRSLVGDNMSLIVIDGMPILPDLTLSSTFTGYSKNILRNVSLKEIDNISVTKGYDAAPFGAVSSNGVIMINTDRAIDMETKVEFETVNGVGLRPRKLPLLDAADFKNYLYRIGQTEFNSDELYNRFSFLREDPRYGEGYYAYQHNTDWQDEIFSPAFSTENILKVKGGDAVAKYSLLAGYMQENGIEDNSKMSRYYARFNGDMKMSRKLSMFTNVGFSYYNNNIHEQGMVPEINPILAAIRKPSILGPYRVNKYNQQLSVWDPVRQFGVSNPAVIVNEVEGNNVLYNTMVNLGLSFDFTPELQLRGLFGINYDYNREKMFIPGVSTDALIPLEGGRARNMIRNGAGKSMSYYGNVTLSYQHGFQKGHYLSAMAGVQMLFRDRLYEYAKGINTATDYDRNLSSVKDAFGKYLDGYDDKWKWFNIFANVEYNYKKQLYAGVSLAADAASVTGERSDVFNLYPAANIAWKLNNSSFLRESDFVNDLTIRAEYSMKGNSMLPAMISKYHYVAMDYKEMGGIVRGNIPNDKLKPELVVSTNVGVDFRTLGNKLNLSLDLYNNETRDMLVQEDLGSSYGSKFRYINAGKMETKGIEVGINATVIRTGGFEWNLGATIAHEKAEIKDLGGRDAIVTTLSDGAQIITRVGESPYAFYGLKTNGVYATSAEASADNLVDFRGENFRAGDLRYVNADASDRVIDSKDKMIIGDPTPDFYGGIFTSFRYKNYTLSAQFTYSYGNDVYNAVRRVGESMVDFAGQTRAVKNSWNYEGHQTTVPKAEYGDPMNNSQFSSRWIEDGSYLKLKNLTFNYEYPSKLWIFRSFQAYVSAENVFTLTKYLGYDPEFSYSYDHGMLGVDYGKVPGARTFRLGIRLGI